MNESLVEVRFDEATPAQFREFWEGQGWTVVAAWPNQIVANRLTKSADAMVVPDAGDESYIGVESKGDSCGRVLLGHPIATFGEALRYANNLAQADLFGGWAE